MGKNKVYLAGGLNGIWQNALIMNVKGFEFFNPQNHGLEDVPKQFTAWDLFHVQKSDIIFAYMEKNNPSGFGLTLEVGYAKALNKLIILVDEKSKTDSEFQKKFRIVRESSTVVFEDLLSGINFLKSFK